MTDTERFAYRLRELRTAAGLSRKELADKAGMSAGAVRDYEQAHRRPSWEAAIALARALDVECMAFTQEPVHAQAKPGRGRPRKPVEPPGEPGQQKPAAKNKGRK